ncbi:YxlC family protein [Cohnella fermenti]|uniref:Uncharacterized protein n=1 Tax=Cohnella fermenti TaxID=2565925 RepID=A0A4S4C3B9_9BACL|nr:YxlC family protein [Cohnella fermenti]THF81655.1 hypothetical protein E6C55_07960 [Cohnella fermenti]
MTKRGRERETDGDLGGNAGPSRTSGEQRETEAEEAKAFEELLGDSLRGWDARIEPSVPHLLELEELVSSHREETRRKLRRELAKLWLLGLPIIVGMLMLFRWNAIVFAIAQGAAVTGAILFLAVDSRRNREGKRRWSS